MSRIFIILSLFSLLTLEALEWQSFEEGLLKAKKSHKLVMLDVVRDNCHFCSDMDENVFKDEAMSAWIDSCFVPVKLNLSHDSLPEGMKVQVTPTFIFLTSDKELVKTIQGSWNKQEFKELSEKVCKEY